MLDLGSNFVLLLTLVLVRVSGIVLTAPIFGTNDVPPTVRALFAFALALLIAPVQASAMTAAPRSLIEFGLMLTGELLIGVVLGLGVMVLFAAFQLAGTLVGQLSGMSIGDVFNPGLDENIPIFSQLLFFVAMAVYVLIGGHRLLLAGLLGTFQAIPPGTAAVPVELEELLVRLLTESFGLGIRAAAPAVAALLLATIVLGLVSRSLPQLNILALGFGLNALVTFAILSVSISGVVWLMQDRLEPLLEMLLQTFNP